MESNVHIKKFNVLRNFKLDYKKLVENPPYTILNQVECKRIVDECIKKLGEKVLDQATNKLTSMIEENIYYFFKRLSKIAASRCVYERQRNQAHGVPLVEAEISATVILLRNMDKKLILKTFNTGKERVIDLHAEHFIETDKEKISIGQLVCSDSEFSSEYNHLESDRLVTQRVGRWLTKLVPPLLSKTIDMADAWKREKEAVAEQSAQLSTDTEMNTSSKIKHLISELENADQEMEMEKYINRREKMESDEVYALYKKLSQVNKSKAKKLQKMQAKKRKLDTAIAEITTKKRTHNVTPTTTGAAAATAAAKIVADAIGENNRKPRTHYEARFGGKKYKCVPYGIGNKKDPSLETTQTTTTNNKQNQRNGDHQRQPTKLPPPPTRNWRENKPTNNKRYGQPNKFTNYHQHQRNNQVRFDQESASRCVSAGDNPYWKKVSIPRTTSPAATTAQKNHSSRNQI